MSNSGSFRPSIVNEFVAKARVRVNEPAMFCFACFGASFRRELIAAPFTRPPGLFDSSPLVARHLIPFKDLP
jgi:hypothetical protein